MAGRRSVKSRGTGNHPLNGSTKAINAKSLREAQSTPQAYQATLNIKGKRKQVQLPPVRHQEVAGGHGNRMTMTNPHDIAGGYRAKLAAQARQTYGSRNQAAINQHVEQGNKHHYKAMIEARKRKYDALK